MGKYIADKSAVLLKTEAAPGTYEEPTVVVPLERGGDMWSPEFDKDDFDPESGHHGSKETIIITDFATMPVEMKLKMPSDHTMITVALLACGIVSTAVGTTISYTYDTNTQGTCSLMQVGQRVTTRAYGERGDFGFSAEVGKAVEMSIGFKGMFKEQVKLGAADADNTIPDTPSFDAVYMTKNCAAYLVNGTQAHFTKVEFKQGADIGTPKDTCAGASWTKDVKPELMVSMMDDIDNAQSFNDLKNGTQFSFVIPFFDINGNKKWEFRSPKCVAIDHKTPKSEGLIAIERTYECRKVNGDDNWELVAF